MTTCFSISILNSEKLIIHKIEKSMNFRDVVLIIIVNKVIMTISK